MVSHLRNVLLIGLQSTRTCWKAHRLSSSQCINCLLSPWTRRTVYAAPFNPLHAHAYTATQQETLKQIARYELDPPSIDPTFRFPEQLALSIGRLWRDPLIPLVMDYRSSEFYLMDNAC